MKTRLEILKNSLEKKQNDFDAKLKTHFDTVKLANGQPLNDKKNGQSTLNKWEKQNDALRNLDKSIEKTKSAIDREQRKISNVESVELPAEIQELIKSGVLVQWRKFPRFFFVAGVEKGRIVLTENGLVANKYYKDIECKEQRDKFRLVYNDLLSKLQAKV